MTYWAERKLMRKFYAIYIIALFIALISIFCVHPTGKDAVLSWSLFFNAFLVFIIIVISRGISAHEILLSPGFSGRYQRVLSENLDYIAENTKLVSELEWIKGADFKEEDSESDGDGKIVRIKNPVTKRFMPENGMTTKEKRVRSYVMAARGASDEEIAEKIGLKPRSVPVYKAEGKKIVKPYVKLLAGHQVEEIVDFFCNTKQSSSDEASEKD